MQTIQNEKAALDVAAFCARYSIGRVKTYEEINAGRLKATKLGRKTLIRVADADAWLASLPNLRTQRAA